MSQESTMGLAPNIAGLLCYVLFWVSGIIFLILEQKNNWVRFHAAQSIIVFGTLSLVGVILGWIPFAGPVAGVTVGYLEGQFVLNPTLPQLATSSLDCSTPAARSCRRRRSR